MLKTLIISWIVATVSTDKNENDDKMHRLPLKRNTSRREVSLMFDKVEREGEDQFEMEERFNKNNSVAYTGKYGAWIFRSNVLSNSRFDNHTYIIYAIPGERLTVRSWSLNDTALSFTLKKGSMVRLNASFNEEKYNVFEDEKKRLVFKYNLTSREAFMIFNNACSEDEGQYEMEESLKKRNGNANTTKYGAWIFHLFVLRHDEIKRGNIGEEIIILQMNESTTYYPRVYHYSHLVTVLRHGDCSTSSNSQFYGRLRCERDKVNNRYKIKIQNVSPTDTGLYRVNAEGHDTDRCFLYITVKGTSVESRLNTITVHDISEGINHSLLNTATLPQTVHSISSEVTRIPLCVPVYIIPIIAGSVGVLNIIICCLIRIERKNVHGLEAERSHALEDCVTDLYLTPISGERHLPIPLSEDGGTSHLINIENMQLDSSMQLLQGTQSISSNVYEVIATSRFADPENVSCDQELLYESTEAFNAPSHATSGYLTVLD